MKRTSALYNSIIGISGLVICTALVVGSAALLFSPRQQISLEKIKAENMTLCKNSLTQDGYEVKQEGNALTASMPDLKDYRTKLLQSSLAISRCTNLKLVSYCMGNCKNPRDPKAPSQSGTIFILSYFDPELK